MNREEYKERMKNDRYKDLVVTNCDSGEDYVFISYRGNSWKTVLTEIVYKLQKEYKLRIYFDKEFASETNIWIEQFIKNMDSKHCKACLCFIDEGYVTSYATLMELMHAMNPRSKLGESIFPVSFPINWDKLNNADRNTGLGVVDPDNPGWEEEKTTFNREFEIIKKRYPAIEDYYYEGAVLRECDCKDIMTILQPKNKRDYANEDAYYRQFIVDPLRRKCPSVFAEAKIPGYKVIIENNGRKTEFQIKEGESVPKQDPGIREGFEFEGWFTSGTDKEWDFSNQIHEDIEVYTNCETTVEDPPEGYKYKIFGKEYYAGSREQGKLMYDAFEELTSRYPEYAEQLTQRTCVAKAEDVKNANTKDADPKYFRGCKAFNIDGGEYLVGTSYGYKAKLSEIEGMFKICGVPLREFVLNGKPLEPDGPGPQPTLWEYKTKGTCSKLIWNGETTGEGAVIKVLKGSVAATPSLNFEKSCKPAFTLKANLEEEGILQNDMFVEDYTYDKVSTMINLLNGGSVSTPAEVKTGHLRKVENAVTDEFEYVLWDTPHTASKLSDMMHDVFDLIAEKYPEKIEDIANDDKITCVARKDDIDNGRLQGSKANRFFHYGKREHISNGVIYYVNTGYNREGGIDQLEKMLIICEDNANGLKIKKAPEKSSRRGGKSNKPGISEDDMNYIINNGKRN